MKKSTKKHIKSLQLAVGLLQSRLQEQEEHYYDHLVDEHPGYGPYHEATMKDFATRMMGVAFPADSSKMEAPKLVPNPEPAPEVCPLSALPSPEDKMLAEIADGMKDLKALACKLEKIYGAFQKGRPGQVLEPNPLSAPGQCPANEEVIDNPPYDCSGLFQTTRRWGRGPQNLADLL